METKEYTVLTYTDVESFPKFAIVNGDYSKWHKELINAVGTDEEVENELCDFLYDDYGRLKEELGFSEDFPVELLSKIMYNSNTDTSTVVRFASIGCIL